MLGRAGVIAGGANAKTRDRDRARCANRPFGARAGKPGDYPHVLLSQGEAAVTPATPVSPADKVPTTAITPIAAMRQRDQELTRELTLTASMVSGTRTLTLGAKAVPVPVGRSRNQDLVVDWAHEGVSGHHIDLTNIDDTGAEVEVHGDNGVIVSKRTAHPPGESVPLARERAHDPRARLGRGAGMHVDAVRPCHDGGERTPTPMSPTTVAHERAIAESATTIERGMMATAGARLDLAAASCCSLRHDAVNEDSHSALDGAAPVSSSPMAWAAARWLRARVASWCAACIGCWTTDASTDASVREAPAHRGSRGRAQHREPDGPAGAATVASARVRWMRTLRTGWLRGSAIAAPTGFPRTPTAEAELLTHDDARTGIWRRRLRPAARPTILPA